MINTIEVDGIEVTVEWVRRMRGQLDNAQFDAQKLEQERTEHDANVIELCLYEYTMSLASEMENGKEITSAAFFMVNYANKIREGSDE